MTMSSSQQMSLHDGTNSRNEPASIGGEEVDE